MDKSALLFSSYLPPVRYFSKLVSFPKVIIEKWEHFPKQTYRNRCEIATAMGMLTLSIPIQHGNNKRVRITDIKIANEFPWQKIHWRSIETAYRCSPFFEYYEDLFSPFYHQQFSYLFDYNSALLETIFKSLAIDPAISYSSDFQKNYPEDIADFRGPIYSKPSNTIQDPHFTLEAYNQVFSNKHGFIPDLSIIDLLFNEGPSSLEKIKKSVSNTKHVVGGK
jgi:hypothetical protein